MQGGKTPALLINTPTDYFASQFLLKICKGSCIFGAGFSSYWFIMPSPCDSCKDTCTDGKAKCGSDCKCGDDCKCAENPADNCGCAAGDHSCQNE